MNFKHNLLYKTWTADMMMMMMIIIIRLLRKRQNVKKLIK